MSSRRSTVSAQDATDDLLSVIFLGAHLKLRAPPALRAISCPRTVWAMWVMRLIRAIRVTRPVWLHGRCGTLLRGAWWRLCIVDCSGAHAGEHLQRSARRPKFVRSSPRERPKAPDSLRPLVSAGTSELDRSLRRNRLRHLKELPPPACSYGSRTKDKRHTRRFAHAIFRAERPIVLRESESPTGSIRCKSSCSARFGPSVFDATQYRDNRRGRFCLALISASGCLSATITYAGDVPWRNTSER